MKNPPSYLIGIGLPRTGTTSLWRFLDHSSVIASTGIKDSGIFLRPTPPAEAPWNEAVKQPKFLLDFTTSYYRDPEALKTIAKAHGQKKILLCLRNPVERAFSLYVHRLVQYFGRGLIPEDIPITNTKAAAQNLRHFGFGLSFLDIHVRNNQGLITPYASLIDHCFNLFGRDQVKILIQEEWMNDSAGLVRDLSEFLGCELGLDGVDLSHEQRGTMPFYMLFHPRNYLRRSFLINHVETLRPQIEPSFMRLGLVADGKLELLPEIPATDIDTALRGAALWTDRLPSDYAEHLYHDLFADDVRKTEDLLGKDLSLWRRFRDVAYVRIMPPLKETSDWGPTSLAMQL